MVLDDGCTIWRLSIAERMGYEKRPANGQPFPTSTMVLYAIPHRAQSLMKKPLSWPTALAPSRLYSMVSHLRHHHTAYRRNAPNKKTRPPLDGPQTLSVYVLPNDTRPEGCWQSRRQTFPRCLPDGTKYPEGSTVKEGVLPDDPERYRTDVFPDDTQIRTRYIHKINPEAARRMLPERQCPP
jgi:hypothetical protein